MTKHIPTHLTQEYILESRTRTTFAAWINHMNHCTFLRRCDKGCHLVFKFRRKHMSNLKEYRHLLN